MPRAKPKKTKRSHVYLLIDRSGSMDERWEEATQSINAYVNGLAEADPIVTLCLFYDETAGPQFDFYPAVLASEWDGIGKHRPMGGTPLCDGIAKIAYLALKGNYDRAAIVIMTDGLENSSRHTSKAAAKAVLDLCRARDWEVLFLGADFDAIPQAALLGSDFNKSINMRQGFYGTAMTDLAGSTGAYFLTGQSVNIGDDMKARAMGQATGKKAA